MAVDLAQAAAKLSARHGDAFGFRFGLLDLLFATGCSVREQALALPHGDALCIRTAGPAAPVAGPRLVVVAADLELPATSAGDPAARWPTALQSLGGAAVPIAWLATLQALLADSSQRPWELIYVRGPAMGTAALLSDLTAPQPATTVVALVPAAAGRQAPLDLVRLQLTRPRNVWRFPACDHTVALQGQAAMGQAWPALRRVLASLGPAAAWTLHDLAIGAGEAARFSAVLRSSVAAAGIAGVDCRPLANDARLLFPINDALTALTQLPERLPPALGEAFETPLQATTMPDGLVVHALAAPWDGQTCLPTETGALTLDWAWSEVARPAPPQQRLIGVSAGEAAGVVPAGIDAKAVVWRTPQCADPAELGALQRACAVAVRGSAAA